MLELAFHDRKSRSKLCQWFVVFFLTGCFSRFVESKYNLEIHTAQVTQLSKALQKGAENNVFLLPKGNYLYCALLQVSNYRSQVLRGASSLHPKSKL